MVLIFYKVAAGDKLPRTLLETLFFFLPTKAKIDDSDPNARRPEDTRPIGKRNCLLKIISAVLAVSLSSVISTALYHRQRGFRQAHKFIHNIIELDTEARICGVMVEAHWPILFFSGLKQCLWFDVITIYNESA